MMITVLMNSRITQVYKNMDINIYSIAIYILIHPCILGNRGVITKILSLPQALIIPRM